MTQPPWTGAGSPEPPDQPDQPAQVAWYPPSPAVAPDGQWEELGTQPPVPAPRRSRGKLVGAVVVTLAVVAGGTATYLAVADKDTTGAASPDKAIQSVVSDLNRSDLAAALDALPPAERDALSMPFTQDIKQLQRLKVLSGSADPGKVSGLTFRLTGLQYGQPVAVNDHVQLVSIIGGSLQVSADAAKVPFTSELLKTAFPHGLPASAKGSQHVDLAQQVRRDGHPIRLAAQKVGGRWYPSLFYTVAAASAADSGITVLPAADHVPAVGAPSPQQAVGSEIRALLAGDYRTAIELTAPDEMAALHDYGGIVLANAHPTKAPVTISNLQFATTKLSGGAVRVALRGVTVGVRVGGITEKVTVTVDGGCFAVVVDGQHLHLCPSDLVATGLHSVTGLGLHIKATKAQRQALADLISGYTSSVGVVTSQIGGQWYLDPVRSGLDNTGSVLSGLHSDDLIQLITFVQGLGG